MTNSISCGFDHVWIDQMYNKQTNKQKFTSKESSLTSLQQQWPVKQSDMLEHNITYSRQM